MAKRLTQIDRAIQNVDAQIAALQLARQHLVQQQRAIPARPAAKPAKEA